MRNVLIMVGLVFVVILMIFHKNPVREAMEARKKALEGKDPLIVSIEEHNKANASSGVAGAMKGVGLGSLGDLDNSDDAGVSPPPAPGATVGGAQPYNATNPYQQNSPYLQAQPRSQVPVDPNPTYYPPPPLAPGQAAPIQQPAYNYGQHSFNHHRFDGFYLRSGQKLQFAGIYVYTVDAKGNKIPMPDGRYPLMNMADFINVKDGKKIIVSNGW